MSAGTDEQSGVRTVKSADRTLHLLEYLGSRTTPATLREVSDDLDIPRASAYALLVTLQRRGWVETDGSQYRLGIRSLRAGAAFLESDDVVAQTSEVLTDLARDLEETIHLARLDGDNILYLATRPSPYSLGILIRPGRRLPAHGTALGKAILAYHDWEEVDQLLPKELAAATEHTIIDRGRLHGDLEQTATRGYAIDEQETAVGLRCFAVPILSKRPPLDAISCSVPMVRLTDEKESLIVKALLDVKERFALI